MLKENVFRLVLSALSRERKIMKENTPLQFIIKKTAVHSYLSNQIYYIRQTLTHTHTHTGVHTNKHFCTQTHPLYSMNKTLGWFYTVARHTDLLLQGQGVSLSSTLTYKNEDIGQCYHITLFLY